MARPLRIEFPGAFYHVIQRGIERKNIFASESDKKKFLFLLNAAHVSYGAVFHSYVLMDNHYHLILETPRSPLSKMMHYINAGYAVAERIVNNDKGLIRSLSIYLSHKHTGRTLRETADFYGGIKYTGVSQAWRRMEIKKETDKEIAQIITKIEEELNKVSNVKT